MINLKREALSALGGIVYVILFIWGIRYFELGFWAIYGVVLASTVVWSFIKRTFKIKELFKTGFIIFILMIVFRLLSQLGVWGYVLGIIIICAFIIYSRWGKFIEIKYHIETMIWGKPLKEFIDNKEKPPKIEVVWGKDNKKVKNLWGERENE